MQSSVPRPAAAAGTIEIGGDLPVNRMGFGAMRLTGPGVSGPPRDPAAARAVLRRAVALGVDFIDTADAYGPEVNESLIAEALYPYPAGVVIATKGGHVRGAAGEWAVDGRPEHLRRACEASLRRLRMEEIPLYQLHRPDPGVPFAESFGALVELQEEGKVRHLGVSNVTHEQLSAAQALAPVATVQNRYNLRDRESESMLGRCEAEGLAFLPWAPIQDSEGVDALAGIAERLGATRQQTVLAWLLARSPAMLVIPGTGSGDHLEENVAAAALQLEAADVAVLTTAAS
jgi:pyridoxine 4-dehydrogenase